MRRAMMLPLALLLLAGCPFAVEDDYQVESPDDPAGDAGGQAASTADAGTDGAADAASDGGTSEGGAVDPCENGRKDGERSSAWVERQLVKIHAALAAMGKGLGDKPFCSGIHFSLSDIAVGCALGYLDFRFAEIDWRGAHPNLTRLHDKLSQRPSFRDTLPPVA